MKLIAESTFEYLIFSQSPLMTVMIGIVAACAYGTVTVVFGKFGRFAKAACIFLIISMWFFRSIRFDIVTFYSQLVSDLASVYCWSQILPVCVQIFRKMRQP